VVDYDFRNIQSESDRLSEIVLDILELILESIGVFLEWGDYSHVHFSGLAGCQGVAVLAETNRVIHLIALAVYESLIWKINFPSIGHKNFERDFFSRVALEYLRIFHLQFSD
jgi:hypothetical protein